MKFKTCTYHTETSVRSFKANAIENSQEFGDRKTLLASHGHVPVDQKKY